VTAYPGGDLVLENLSARTREPAAQPRKPSDSTNTRVTAKIREYQERTHKFIFVLEGAQLQRKTAIREGD